MHLRPVEARGRRQPVLRTSRRGRCSRHLSMVMLEVRISRSCAVYQLVVMVLLLLLHLLLLVDGKTVGAGSLRGGANPRGLDALG